MMVFNQPLSSHLRKHARQSSVTKGVPVPEAGLDIKSKALALSKTEVLVGEAVEKHKYHLVVRIFEKYIDTQGSRDELGQLQMGRRITTSLLNHYLEALVQLRRFPDVEEAVTYFSSTSKRSPNPRTYALLLRAYIQSLNLRKARLLIFEMIARGIKIDTSIVRIILRGEGRWALSLGSIDSLLDLLSSGKIEFRHIENYNLIMNAYLRRDRTDKARIVLDRIINDGLQLDAETFHMLMQYQAKKEGSRGAYIVLNSMMAAGISPESRHLNVLTATLAFERRMDLGTAASLFSSHNLVPNTATCNIILRALLRREFNFHNLENHFDEMKKLRLRPNAYTLTILLNEYKRKSRRWERVQNLLQLQILINPSLVNQVTNNVVIHNIISESPESFNTSSAHSFIGNKGLRLQWDLRTLTNLVAAYSRARDWSRVVDLHRRIQKRQIKLDRHFYRVLVKSLLDGQKYKESMEIACSLYGSDDILDQIFGRECEIRIAHSIFKTTKRGNRNVLESIDRFLKFTDEKGVMVSEKHCNLIAIACLDIHRERLAVEILESRYHRRGRFQGVESRERLGMSSWTILMRAYARRGKEAVQDLRLCVKRALSTESCFPTRTFLNFLNHLGVNPKLRSTNPEDCDFFLQKHIECINKLRLASHTSRGRPNLTKRNILRWVNNI